MLELRPAFAAADWELARALFREYAAEVDAPCCFDGLEAELAAIDRRFTPPEGRLLLAFAEDEPAGCGGFRVLPDGAAEGRRLYVRPARRGRGLGAALVRALLEEARLAGRPAFRLETLPGKMSAAAALYRELGFREVPPHVPRPIPGALYMERRLD